MSDLIKRFVEERNQLQRELTECRTERDGLREVCTRAKAFLWGKSLEGGQEMIDELVAALHPGRKPTAPEQRPAKCEREREELMCRISDLQSEIQAWQARFVGMVDERDAAVRQKDIAARLLAKHRERFNSHRARAHVLVASLQDAVTGLEAERDGLRELCRDIANGWTLADDAANWRHKIIGKARAALKPTT